jgi:hypothetical protein
MLANLKGLQHPHHYPAQLSTAVKPTTGVPYNSTIKESDTGYWFIFTPNGWERESLPAIVAAITGTVAVSSIAAGDNNIGNVDVATLPALPAGSNNIGDVDVLTLPNVTIGTNAALVAGEAHIGETGGWSDLIKVTPTITAGAYSAQDMVGGKLTLTNAMRVVGGKGYLYSLEVIDTDKIAAALDIHLFSAMAGAYADNGAEAISAADALNHLGVVRILATDYLAKANFYAAQPDPSTFKSILLKSGAASRDLFAIVVCTGTPTYTHTTGLQFNFGIIGD